MIICKHREAGNRYLNNPRRIFSSDRELCHHNSSPWLGPNALRTRYRSRDLQLYTLYTRRNRLLPSARIRIVSRTEKPNEPCKMIQPTDLRDHPSKTTDADLPYIIYLSIISAYIIWAWRGRISARNNIKHSLRVGFSSSRSLSLSLHSFSLVFLSL